MNGRVYIEESILRFKAGKMRFYSAGYIKRRKKVVSSKKEEEGNDSENIEVSVWVKRRR